jgi:hypothetical protein
MTKSIVSTPAFVIVPDVATQFRLRNGGSGEPGSVAYIQATRALAGWAKTDETNKALVHALVHLGWCSTSGARKTVSLSGSKAWAPTTGLGARDVLTVGEDAAEAAVRVIQALAEAGAPVESLDVVRATFAA